MAAWEQITFTPRYPSYGYFVTAEGEFKALEYKDHVELWRVDSRGQWRRRKRVPEKLTRYFRVLKKYDLIPAAGN